MIKRARRKNNRQNITSAGFFKDLFRIDANPIKGLVAVEWVNIAYLAFTLLLIFFTYTKCEQDFPVMMGNRISVFVIIIALWWVYRMIPCRFTMLARMLFQVASLSIWYPDIYYLNKMFPNLDHFFATWEQQIFGCQPALLFSEMVPGKVMSELMSLGYGSYYFLLVLIIVYYFIWHYKEFERATFILITAFFIYYVIFIFLSVMGPQYYYPVIGYDNVAKGIFPTITSQPEEFVQIDILGWQDGLFHKIIMLFHNAGERPIAAFPSSHVGAMTVIMLLIAHTRNWKLFAWMTPLSLLLCLATVYLRAHYVIDAIAGLISGIIIYIVLLLVSKRYIRE